MANLEKNDPFGAGGNSLFRSIRQLIEEGRQNVAQAVNAGLTMTYWNVGKRINEDILQNERAEYGKQVLQSLSAKLTEEFGKGWSIQQLRHCRRLAEVFPKKGIVYTLCIELSWSHLRKLIFIENETERDFYAEMAKLERWSVRTLRGKIDSMLFQRTAISKKPEKLAKQELKNLRDEDTLSIDLVFRDHYVLDFLNLKDTYSEQNLEAAILRKIENFILELGAGFAFVARQKRMVIDNKDFYLDLLFYHRKLKRLVALDLKIGAFQAGYKGQMELYLRWLEKHETEEGEHQPIGLILCAEGNSEQIELLQLDQTNIRVAEYITEHLPKELLMRKLHEFRKAAERQMAGRG